MLLFFSCCRLSPQYQIASLKEDDVSVVWTHWNGYYFDSEDGVKHDIAHFPSVSIHKRTPTANVKSMQEEKRGKLVSWIRTTKNGWMGSTFTQQQHRRRGLANKATLVLAHQLLEKNLMAFVLIKKHNTVSMKFHDSIGFKRQCHVLVLQLLPVSRNNP